MTWCDIQCERGTWVWGHLGTHLGMHVCLQRCTYPQVWISASPDVDLCIPRHVCTVLRLCTHCLLLFLPVSLQVQRKGSLPFHPAWALCHHTSTPPLLCPPPLGRTSVFSPFAISLPLIELSMGRDYRESVSAPL